MVMADVEEANRNKHNVHQEILTWVQMDNPAAAAAEAVLALQQAMAEMVAQALCLLSIVNKGKQKLMLCKAHKK
jgi:hypothetical protein